MCYYCMCESGVGARGIPVESEEVFEVSFLSLSLSMHFQGQMQVSGQTWAESTVTLWASLLT